MHAHNGPRHSVFTVDNNREIFTVQSQIRTNLVISQEEESRVKSKDFVPWNAAQIIHGNYPTELSQVILSHTA